MLPDYSAGTDIQKYLYSYLAFRCIWMLVNMILSLKILHVLERRNNFSVIITNLLSKYNLLILILD